MTGLSGPPYTDASGIEQALTTPEQMAALVVSAPVLRRTLEENRDKEFQLDTGESVWAVGKRKNPRGNDRRLETDRSRAGCLKIIGVYFSLITAGKRAITHAGSQVCKFTDLDNDRLIDHVSTVV